MGRVVSTVLVALALVFASGGSARAGDGCYSCGSGSKNGCQECRYHGSDTFDARKACEAKGCKVSGTTMCSTASNVKVCSVESKQPILACTR